MVITALEEKENKKFYVPIRGGNRGGWDRFKWENVMYLPYKERELYLGNSAMIGFLDKGGKWRKKNWYLKTEKEFKSQNPQEEMLEAKRRDEQRLRAALGEDAFDESQGEQLNAAELEELKRKIKLKEEGENPGGTAGLGFDKLKVEIKAQPAIDSSNPYRLEGSGGDDQPPELENREEREHRKKKRRDRQANQFVKDEYFEKREGEPRERRSKDKKKEKKQKKDKKEKKEKKDRKEKERKKQRRRSESNRSRSVSNDRHRKRRDSRNIDDSRSLQKNQRRYDRHESRRSRSRSRDVRRDRRRSASEDSRKRSRSGDRKHPRRAHDRSKSRDRRRSRSP